MLIKKLAKYLQQSTALVIVCLIFNSCASTLYVAPKKVDCSGVAAQKCYLVRSGPADNWIMHYQDIAGFDYELGFSYRIKVKREKIKNPPADGSTFRYVLVEVLEQKDVTEDIEIDDLLGKEWKLEYLMLNNIQYGVDEHAPTLKFEKDGKVNGTGGCNKLFSTFLLTGRTINFNEVGSTRMMCEGKMELEEAFVKLLNMELRAIFDDGKLVFSGNGGNRMIFDHN